MFLNYLFTINTLKHITLFKIRRYSYMFRSFWTILRECHVPSIEVATIVQQQYDRQQTHQQDT